MKEKCIPYAMDKGREAFWREVLLCLLREQDKGMRKHLPPENQQIFHHGTGWTFQREEATGFNPSSGSMEHVSVPCHVEIDRLIVNDLEALTDFINSLAAQLEEKFLEGLLREAGKVTEETGNVFNVTDDTQLPEAFLTCLENMVFCVDREGKPSAPTLFLSPKMAAKLAKAVDERGPEFRKRIDDLRALKEQEALEREETRFKRYEHEK